jgi:hypothetical protein
MFGTPAAEVLEIALENAKQSGIPVWIDDPERLLQG